jgi:hypothetical protein
MKKIWVLYIRGHKTAPFRAQMELGRSVFRSMKPWALARGASLFLLLFLSGCATYKFHKGQSPDDKGYVVSRGDKTILEYTAGRDNSAPDLKLARERFERRKATVEHYYKKMGYIENRFKQFFWDPPALFVDFIGGIFRLPFIAARDYKYEHDPRYREKITKMEEKQDAYEAARIEDLKERLNAYIQKDLVREASKTEGLASAQPATLKQEAQEKPAQETTLNIPAESKQRPEGTEPRLKAQEKNLRQKEEQISKMLDEQARFKEIKPQPVPGGPVAVIRAKPAKGFSPLKVQFYGYKSHSPHGKIVSYYWEFGDGDTSAKVDPVNTYWSTNYGSRYFTVTLTVKDDKGNSATSDAIIEVVTK